MDDEREEGEIVDLNDDDIYENIISSDEADEDEDRLRQRIEELEAKNSELEKIASISKTYDYGLGCGSSNFINLVDDDDESYYRQPSKYEYSSYTSSRKRSRSKRRKQCRHESKKSKRYKPYKTETIKRKKTQPNRTRVSSDSSSDDEFELDRNKLQAALKRNNTTSIRSTTLKRKLIGVSKTVEDFIESSKKDDGDEDISRNIEIMHLLNKINIVEIPQKSKAAVRVEKEQVQDTEACLDEQELRIIALKSAILKKAEARKKRKIIETQPYSPTDDVVIENVLATKLSVSVKANSNNELGDNMEISPAVSPTHQDGCLQPIDMELESDDESQPLITDTQHEMMTPEPVIVEMIAPNSASEDLNNSTIVHVPDEMSLNNANVPEDTNQINLSLDSSQQQPQPEEGEDDDDEEALRASLLANMKAAKKKSSTTDPHAIIIDEDRLPLETAVSDVTVDMEHLRKQVFSSMGKRKESHRHMLPNPFAQKFSGHVPRPMEMSMPQITSTLKEALKRIKESDKQSVDIDVAKVDTAERTHQQLNVVTEVAKEIHVDMNRSRTEQQEIIELKNLAQKLNGSNLSSPKVHQTIIIEQPIPIVTKKPVEQPINHKINDVLKNVTCNNASIEIKTKDSSIVPLVISNKIETASLDKTDAVIRTLKVVAQKKVVAEPPHLSLNQKENQQQLRKVAIAPKRTAEDKLPVAKKTKVNNVKAVSRVITTPVEKPVKKMIIQLNNSDTDSDDLGLELQTTETSLNHKSYSGVASPVSFNFSPSSPANFAESKPSDAIPSTNDNFQRKLDEYLKSARTKVEQTKVETTKTLKKSPSLVSHLPPSSQLEYRKLINRMALLEKQRLLNKSKAVAVTVAKPKPPNTIISVTIANDLCTPLPKADGPIVQQNGVDDTSSRKVIQSEIAAKSRNVDPETPAMDIGKVSPATVVVNDSTITSNTPKKDLPDRSRTPEETPSTPEKFTENFMQNFATFSVDEKNYVLQKSEVEYMRHSESYLVDLNNMSLLVNKARDEKEKQFEIESEIEQLEARVQELKKQLVDQKVSLLKLYPVISTSHKNIMKKRSRSLQLSKKCRCIGSKTVGAEYKIPGDRKVEIAEKVKSLSSETKLLKNMKKPVDSNPQKTASTLCTEKKCMETEHVVDEGDKHTTATTTPAALHNPESSEKPSDDVQQSTVNGPSDNIPMPSSMMTYTSPLEHMKNIGVTNPDSIVCPFQLLGQCEDKECTYQHLS